MKINEVIAEQDPNIDRRNFVKTGTKFGGMTAQQARQTYNTLSPQGQDKINQGLNKFRTGMTKAIDKELATGKAGPGGMQRDNLLKSKNTLNKMGQQFTHNMVGKAT